MFLDEAYAQAEEALKKNEVPVGAVVVHEGEVIGRGHNLRETTHQASAHAEFLAVQAASAHLQSWRLMECDLYVTLEPCPMCLALLQQARIRKLIYGAPDPKGGAISLEYRLDSDERLNHGFEVQLESRLDCSEILKTFFKNRRGKG